MKKCLFLVAVRIIFEQPIIKNVIFHFVEFDVFDTLSGHVWIRKDSSDFLLAINILLSNAGICLYERKFLSYYMRP